VCLEKYEDDTVTAWWAKVCPKPGCGSYILEPESFVERRQAQDIKLPTP
jgi:hypothetical protein